MVTGRFQGSGRQRESGMAAIFVRSFRKILLEAAGIVPTGKNIYKQGKIYVLKFGGKQQSIKIAKWLYSDDGSSLDRKINLVKGVLI